MSSYTIKLGKTGLALAAPHRSNQVSIHASMTAVPPTTPASDKIKLILSVVTVGDFIQDKQTY